MSKILLFYVEWPNTKKNHAGIAYLCKYLSKKNKEIKKLKAPPSFNFLINIRIKGLRRFNKYINNFLLVPISGMVNFFIQNLYFAYIKRYLKKSDTLVFMEYITLPKYRLHQELMALKLRNAEVPFKMIGMTHLPIPFLISNKIYANEEELISQYNLIDKIIVLGSSLKYSLIGLGLENKVIQTYHYVDINYYKPSPKKHEDERLRLIVMGNLMRDFIMLKEIIIQCPFAYFDLCSSLYDLSEQFKGLKNVIVHGFLSENNLKKLIQNADVSLNVMQDTVGSNVITTSMACGKAMIVSNVGSIHDYCDDTNAFFCLDVSEFRIAINKLSEDKDLLNKMSLASLKKAKAFSIDNFSQDFKTILSL